MTLKKQVVSGVKWVVLAKILGHIVSIISIVILAKLLTPDDFGIFAILMIFVGFLNMFVGMGTSAAIVHMDNPSEKLLSSIFYFNIFSGILFCLILILLSGPISVFFENPEIDELLMWLSLTFIISSFSSVQGALFTKKLNFKTPTMIELIATFISLTVAIIAAIKGLEVYSLIIRTLANSILSTILIWITSQWTPKLIFSIKELKKVFHFTTNLTGFTFMNYLSRNADNFLIGKFLGSSSLGVYNMGYTIMLYPLQNISDVLVRVLFPAFSQIKDDNEKLKKMYLRVIFFIALVSFPLMTGLMATSDIFVSVVFGEKWQNLAVLLFILAPVGLMQSITRTLGSIFMAKGNVKTMFRIGSINATIIIISFIIGIPFGTEGVAISYASAISLILYPTLAISWRQIDLSVREGFSEIFPILVFSIIMGLGVAFLGEVFENHIENLTIRLTAMVLSGVIMYLILIRVKYGKLMSLLDEVRN